MPNPNSLNSFFAQDVKLTLIELLFVNDSTASAFSF